MMREVEYEFVPPGGVAALKVLGLQPYSPGQDCEVTVWRVEPPPKYATELGGDIEFDSWNAMVSTLASVFCKGDQAVASNRLVLKFDQRRP
jgi:hypothetical protein